MTIQSRPRAGGRRADSPETAGNHSPGLAAAQSVARLLRRQRGAVRRLAIAFKTTPARTFARSPNNHEPESIQTASEQQAAAGSARGGPTFWCPVAPWTAASADLFMFGHL